MSKLRLLINRNMSGVQRPASDYSRLNYPLLFCIYTKVGVRLTGICSSGLLAGNW